MSHDPDELSTLYEELIDTYELEWDRHGHRSLHLAYYDDETTEPAAAAMNTMRLLSETAGITSDDRVLNIGCGAGEDAIWNARAHDATVHGVDIGERQIELARENAEIHDVADRVTFAQDDFHELVTVSDNSVTVVWGLEALSHSPDRLRVLEQAKRVLVSGGRVAFLDIFLRTETDDDRVAEINEGLGLHLGSIDAFETALRESGFVNISISEKTEGVTPATKQRRRSARIVSPVGKALRRIGINRFSEAQLGAFRASSLIHELISEELLGYYLITAELP